MKRKYTKYEIEFVKNNYKKFGITYCSKRLNLSVFHINKIAKSIGISLSYTDICKIRSLSKIKEIIQYKVNPSNFIKFQSPEHVYILGFLWADGHIEKNRYRINCCIKRVDFKYLKPIFKSTGIWNIKHIMIRDKFKLTLIQTSNRILWDFLVENDYLIKSGASPDKILSKIPEHLKHYWWRGYFDGDGCVDVRKTANRVTISSVYNQDWRFIGNSPENHPASAGG